ncbi:hypothetical protein [Halpernia frigidisoli]|uniref:LTXXQ motif family protein n=1 Tax=Halpernia frigidisoli TaxID=1125876 RepID=A0A1I3GGD5_9FLAO|nr:hypothetical protein [Halpernia frigidisoli]SFI22575.1 hypothetical protein SAMN05443292_1833 [Halpernia frigidisoli]
MKKLLFSIALVGFGTFAMAQQTTNATSKMKRGDGKQNMEMRGQKHFDKMKTELNLSDDQVAKLKVLQQNRMADHQQNMAADKTARMQKKANAEAEMKKILTPDQYSKWQTNMKDKMAKGKGKKMMHKGGSPMTMESK